MLKIIFLYLTLKREKDDPYVLASAQTEVESTSSGILGTPLNNKNLH